MALFYVLLGVLDNTAKRIAEYVGGIGIAYQYKAMRIVAPDDLFLIVDIDSSEYLGITVHIGCAPEDNGGSPCDKGFIILKAPAAYVSHRSELADG